MRVRSLWLILLGLVAGVVSESLRTAGPELGCPKPAEPSIQEKLWTKIHCSLGCSKTSPIVLDIKEVMHQSQAISTIDRLLRSKDPNAPLVLHLAGPPGTGKTTAARAVGLAASSCPGPTERGCLFKEINCMTYRVLSDDPAILLQKGDAMLAEAKAHLRKHPNGILFFDEVDALHELVLGHLAPLLRGADLDGINTAHATIFLASNIGGEGDQQALSELDFNWLVTRITQASWGSAAAQVQVVRFKPFSDSSAAEIAHRILHRLACQYSIRLSYSADVLKWFFWDAQGREESKTQPLHNMWSISQSISNLFAHSHDQLDGVESAKLVIGSQGAPVFTGQGPRRRPRPDL